MGFYVQSHRYTDRSPLGLAIAIHGGLLLELGCCDGQGASNLNVLKTTWF